MPVCVDGLLRLPVNLRGKLRALAASARQESLADVACGLRIHEIMFEPEPYRAGVGQMLVQDGRIIRACIAAIVTLRKMLTQLAVLVGRELTNRGQGAKLQKMVMTGHKQL